HRATLEPPLLHDFNRGRGIPLAALPTVQDCLSEGRLKATRRADGRWDLEGEADPIRVFFGDSGVAGVGKKQKATVTGNVTGVIITPVVSGATASASTPAVSVPSQPSAVSAAAGTGGTSHS